MTSIKPSAHFSELPPSELLLAAGGDTEIHLLDDAPDGALATVNVHGPAEVLAKAALTATDENSRYVVDNGDHRVLKGTDTKGNQDVTVWMMRDRPVKARVKQY